MEFLKILPTRGEQAFVDFYICLTSDKDDGGANQPKLAELLVSALPTD